MTTHVDARMRHGMRERDLYPAARMTFKGFGSTEHKAPTPETRETPQDSQRDSRPGMDGMGLRSPCSVLGITESGPGETRGAGVHPWCILRPHSFP